MAAAAQDFILVQNFHFQMEALEKNIIIFGADMISSVHINNEGKDILTLNSNPFILSFMQRFENGYHFEAIRFSAHPQRSMRLSM